MIRIEVKGMAGAASAFGWLTYEPAGGVDGSSRQPESSAMRPAGLNLTRPSLATERGY